MTDYTRTPRMAVGPTRPMIREQFAAIDYPVTMFRLGKLLTVTHLPLAEWERFDFQPHNYLDMTRLRQEVESLVYSGKVVRFSRNNPVPACAWTGGSDRFDYYARKSLARKWKVIEKEEREEAYRASVMALCEQDVLKKYSAEVTALYEQRLFKN